jgi:hypothetical protein
MLGRRVRKPRNFDTGSGATIRRKESEERVSSWTIASGVICAAALYFGLAIIPPSSVFGGICELLGIASGLVFVGLMDGS